MKHFKMDLARLNFVLTKQFLNTMTDAILRMPSNGFSFRFLMGCLQFYERKKFYFTITKANIYHLMAMQSGCDPCASSHSNKSFHCLETMCISRVAAQRNDTFNFISQSFHSITCLVCVCVVLLLRFFSFLDRNLLTQIQ